MPSRLFAGIECFGDRPALARIGGGIVSFCELVSAADAWAEQLAGNPGVVAIEMANEIEPLVAFIGACRAGCPVLLLGEGGIARQRRLRARFRPDYEFKRDTGAWALSRWSVGTAEAWHPDLAVLLTTSGSTGEPKLVRLSHRNVLSNAESIASYLGITFDERAVTSLPLHYSYGLSVVTSHLMAGASIALVDRSLIEEEYWQEFEACGATSFAGVPLMYETLEQTGFLERRVAGLRVMTQAGGRLDPRRVRRFARYGREHGVRFFVMYGQTEASPRMAYLPPESAEQHADCMGTVIPGGRLWIADADGNHISSADTPGELCFAGPNVMMGYAESREDFARESELDVLRTGDIAERTGEGLFRIVGRSSRFVKIAGLRISLDGLETDLVQAGFSCAVTGDDEQIVVGLVTKAVPPELRGLWAERLGIPVSALTFVPLDRLPVLSTGKPDYAAIQSVGRGNAPPREESTLRGELAAIVGRDDVDDD